MLSLDFVKVRSKNNEFLKELEDAIVETNNSKWYKNKKGKPLKQLLKGI